MLDRVFHDRLEEHGRNDHLQAGGIKLLDDAQLVAAKADDLDVEIIVDELELLAQLDEAVGLFSAGGAES